jgi:C-methyltransferase-like protein/putative zinc binding protein/methyltransferase family protein
MTTCRLCGSTSLASVVDLGATPPCERFLTAAQLDEPEPTFPLHLRVCTDCWLAQLPPLITPEDTFTEYAYFSSYSTSWVRHARDFVLESVARLGLGADSFVVEVASNDGYLLQHMVTASVPCLGIEPSVNVGEAARDKGVPTRTAFLDPETGAAVRAEHGPANLVVANNVYAHIPDVIGFTKGLRALVADDGWVSIEVHHLLQMIEQNQYDTIYHEHFSYFSFLTARRVFAAHGLRLFDVEELPTHGGSLRIFGCHEADATKPETERARELASREEAAGLAGLDTYRSYARRVEEDKRAVLSLLIDLKAQGRSIVGYGAPAKGNTLLNYCGIGTDFLDYTVDLNPHKQGHLLPGSHVPIRPVEALRDTRPDIVLILPWNLREEIMEQHAYIREWGGRFAARVPELQVLP